MSLEKYVPTVEILQHNAFPKYPCSTYHHKFVNSTLSDKRQKINARQCYCNSRFIIQRRSRNSSSLIVGRQVCRSRFVHVRRLYQNIIYVCTSITICRVKVLKRRLHISFLHFFARDKSLSTIM